MRQIVFLLALFPMVAHTIPVLNYQIAQDSSQQQLGYSTGRQVNQRVDFAQTSLTITDSTFKENFNYSLGVIALSPDYSTMMIRDQTGIERTLDQLIEKREEYSLTSSLGFGKNGHSVNIGVNTYLNDSPFKTQIFSAGYSYGFFNSTTTLGLNLSTTKQSRPEDYYTETETFRILKRPGVINTDQLTFSIDQVLSSRAKISLEIGRYFESEERPTQDNIQTRLGIALTDSLFLKGGAGYFIEDQSQKAKNERGHFKAYTLESELVYEYNFDHLISLGYDLVIEDETLAFNGAIFRTAFDQYGLGLRSIWTDVITTNLKFRYAESNFNTKELYFMGGFEWSL